MKYIIMTATKEAYIAMLGGSNNYWVEALEVEAESKEEAILYVKENTGRVVLGIKTKEEVEKEEKEEEERIAEKEKKEAEKKEYLANHPEVVAEKKRKAKLAKAKREIRKAEEEIAEAKRKIAYWERVKKEIEKEA